MLAYIPSFTDRRINEIEKCGKQANAYLLTALKDQNKFVTAHYLLVKINLNQYHVSSSHWHKLQIDLHADGTTDLHPKQLDQIINYWENKLK